MRLTPDNIHIPLVEAFGPDWREDAGENPDAFDTQLKVLDATLCPRCDEWWEDGDLVATDAHEDAWCGPCWEAEAQECKPFTPYYDHCWAGADDAGRIQSKQQHDRKEAAHADTQAHS
jgi:hypothetical protein